MVESMGCDEVINSTEENVTERVRELIDGKGVPAVYHVSVGQRSNLRSTVSFHWG